MNFSLPERKLIVFRRCFLPPDSFCFMISFSFSILRFPSAVATIAWLLMNATIGELPFNFLVPLSSFFKNNDTDPSSLPVMKLMFELKTVICIFVDRSLHSGYRSDKSLTNINILAFTRVLKSLGKLFGNE